MEKPKCIICGDEGFNDEIAMCYKCAETVMMADDVFPPETHPTIKPLANRIWNIIDNAEDENGYDGESYEEEYDICPQCGGNLMVKSNPDGTMVETACEDCSYYSVDVE